VVQLRFKKEQTLGQSQENFDSIVGVSMQIKGDVIISKGIRIDGKVIGNISPRRTPLLLLLSLNLRR
jgi:cytoskeletal protein CcmA (bactofilin family)